METMAWAFFRANCSAACRKKAPSFSRCFSYYEHTWITPTGIRISSCLEYVSDVFYPFPPVSTLVNSTSAVLLSMVLPQSIRMLSFSMMTPKP